MSTTATAAPAIPAADSQFGVPTYTKLDNNSQPLPATAEAWAAVRVTLGAHAIDVLAGNVGGRRMPHAEATEAAANVDALGSQDWRLPTLPELEALRHLKHYDPAVDPTYFPDIAADWYWTASPDVSDPAYAWSVYFGYGGAHLSLRGANGYVRAVRSVSPAVASQ